MVESRYKQPKNPLLLEQQTEKEIRSDLNRKLVKHEIRKQEFR